MRTLLAAVRSVFSADHHERDFTVQAPAEPAVYWVEIRATARPNQATWVRSNAIYIRGAEAAPQPAARPAAAASVRIFDGTIDGWRAERSVWSATKRAPS